MSSAAPAERFDSAGLVSLAVTVVAVVRYVLEVFLDKELLTDINNL